MMSEETKQKVIRNMADLLPYVLVIIFILLSTFSIKNKVIMAILFLGALFYKDKEAGKFERK